MGRFTRNVILFLACLLVSALVVGQLSFVDPVESLALFLEPPLNTITGAFALLVALGIVLDQLSGEQETF